MRFSRLINAFFIIGLMTIMAGCGKSSPSGPGSIQGKVVDTGGNGIAAATVMVEGSTSAVKTAADGSYSITSLPPGQYNVMATKQGYLAAEKSVSAQRTTVSVTVKPASVTQAPNIMLIPGGASVDSIIVSHVDPSTGTSLHVGDSRSFLVDFSYVLKSVDNGNVYLDFYINNEQNGTTVIATKKATINQGYGHNTFDISITVPDTNRISLEATMTDANNKVLARNSIPGWLVYSGAIPAAPRLNLEKQAFNGVRLKWSGGNLFDVDSLSLMKSQSLSDNWDRVATLDPLEQEYTDRDVIEGFQYTYRLELRTKNGKVYTSNSIDTVIPQTGIFTLVTGANVGEALFIASPVRNDLYMIDNKNGKIATYDTTDQHLRRESTLGQKLHAIDISRDGEYIYGVSNEGAVVRIDTSTLALKQVVTGLDTPTDLVVSPDGSMIYVASDRHVYGINANDGTIPLQAAASAMNSNITIDRTGTYLFFNAQILRATTLEWVANFDYGVMANPVKDELYTTSGMVYSSKSPWHRLEVVRLPNAIVSPLAVSADGSHLYAYSSGNPTMVYILERVGFTWQAVDSIRLGNYSILHGIISADGEKLYLHVAPDGYGNNPIHMVCIDLAARAAAKL